MDIIKRAIALSLAGIAVPATAQSITDDVRCLALSNGFAQKATEVPAREAASKALIFYIGRLDARGNPQAIKSAMLSGNIDGKTASVEMNACIKRFANAAKAIEALGKAPPQ